MDRNQSGLSVDALRRLRLDFTEEYVQNVRDVLSAMERDLVAEDQNGLRHAVRRVITLSEQFRAVIDGPSEEDGVYVIRTE